MRNLLLASDWYLVGLSITVALVVYPSFRLVGNAQWATFHHRHSRNVTFAVAPAWTLQGATAIWWFLRGPRQGTALLHLGFVGAAVLLTVLRAVPLHARLERRHDGHDVDLLLRWHWVRTLAWTGAAIVALGAP
ncbi:MAG: hypothetical protein KGJ10_00595 [Acidobacteriota bacterium]|nr:hypothetical protein [Acidobacteriota bacterium]MDE3043310.1 hypothetical protein [Acidobacteriota bacterium]MDE3108101.1 hypothetical protein [Acidobacteriota bacterium]MDE3222650.1 hypothetical protein [Acidobacteriota bacterium]